MSRGPGGGGGGRRFFRGKTFSPATADGVKSIDN